jgi:hypothetical protein
VAAIGATPFPIEGVLFGNPPAVVYKHTVPIST